MTDDQGWSAIPNWLLRDPDVSANAKIVYVYLSGRVDKHFVCYPSQGRIAQEASISISSVKRAVEELEKIGVLRKWAERTERGRRNRYRLLVHPFGDRGVSSL